MTVIPSEVEECNAADKFREARLSMPLHNQNMTLRDPSTPLRCAQDDKLRLSLNLGEFF